jgi:hypothetical protein
MMISAVISTPSAGGAERGEHDRAGDPVLAAQAEDQPGDVREQIALLLTNRATEPAIQQALQFVLRTDPDLQVCWAASYAMRLADPS